MRIEFYTIETGEATSVTNYFIMYDRVWIDNECATESQCEMVEFEDFIKECPHIGWRVIS